MEILLQVVLLAVGFVLLIKGADIFVDGASSIAKNLKIPSIIIGLTIVAFGTSAPEAAVSITAAISGSNDIAMGNVIGSNIFNLLMVTGIGALFGTIPVQKSVLKRDFPLSIIAAVLLFVLAFDKLFGKGDVLTLSRIDGIILLAFFALFIWFNVSDALKHQSANPDAEVDGKVKSIPVSILFSVAGIIAITIGGKFTVNAATALALAMGISETLVGLTIVAIGTSLPELVTSIVALKKGEDDIAIGNVLGSNIFNIFFVLGISCTIHTITVDILSIYDTIILAVISIIANLIFAKTKQTTKLFGIGMIITYAIYTAYIIMR